MYHFPFSVLYSSIFMYFDHCLLSIMIFILVLFKVEIFAYVCNKYYFVLIAYIFELFLTRWFFSNPLQCLVMLLLVVFSLLLSSLYSFYTSHPTPFHMCLCWHLSYLVPACLSLTKSYFFFLSHWLLRVFV